MLRLRDYQLALIDGLREGFRAGHRTQMLVAPTGAGKTEVAMALLDAAREKGTRCAMILDRIVLVEQTSARLRKYGIPHGVIQAGVPRDMSQPIQICSVQTLEKMDSFPGVGLLIIDEAHCLRKKTVEFIQRNPDVKVVGLSATPFTNGLAKVYENVVQSVTTKDLIEKGNLVPLQVYIAKEVDMDGAAVQAGEWKEAEITDRAVKLTGDIVSEWEAKTMALFGGPRKTIVFCAGVAHGQDLAQGFARAGYNFVPLSYREDASFKREAVAEFAKPDSQIHGLIATDILTKGFDVPDCMIAISARPFRKSLSSHVQQMGRVMRPADGKEFGVWIDHSGNYLRMQSAWDSVFHCGVSKLKDGAEKARREPTRREKEDSKCPGCERLWIRGSLSCPACGHTRQGQAANIIHTQGVVVPLHELDAPVPERTDGRVKQEFYSSLIYIGQEKGYKRGYAYKVYMERFGVAPKGLLEVPIAPTLDARNWLRHKAIRNSYRKK